MRVLLLNPPGPAGRPFVREGRCEQRLSSYQYRMLPISLPSTAGAVRAKGHEVAIVDACGPRDTASTLEGRVRSLRPELVVVSVSTPTYDADVETIGRLRAWTDAHLTAIGVHVTALPEETLRGSPEWTVTDLAETLARGDDLGAVAGLSLRCGAGIVHNADRGFPDALDELPP